MGIHPKQLFIYTRAQPDSLSQFVDFWVERYDYRNEPLYTGNITGPHTPKGLRELFRWKIGDRLFASNLHLLERCFISRRGEAQNLLDAYSRHNPNARVQFAQDFLIDHFKDGGAIWRIFWLHCWDAQFPIYDQHVHRAMTFIEDKKADELTHKSHKKKIRLYLERYLPFFQHFKDMDGRKVDQALWSFGKFLKQS